MNLNSKLCVFIAEHKDNYEELLSELGIRLRREGNYAIFNYGFDCDFSNPLVQESRGIVIDTEKLEVVCWPFRKFGNYNESYADTIDWNTARVLEKVDGSIVKLWFDFIRGMWQFSTNGVIRAEDASVESALGESFAAVIKRANNYSDIKTAELDKGFTYIFELVSPMTRVVVDYGETSLYHIGTRSNLTGIECEVDIGIKKPKEYPIRSLAECISCALMLNQANLKKCDTGGDEDELEITNEGFVVVDGEYRRVKVKSPDYIMRHKIMTKRVMTKREIIELLLSDRERLIKKCAETEEGTVAFKYYDFKLTELIYEANKIASLAKSLYEEYGNDRGAVARIIKSHPLSDVGFRSLMKGQTGEEVIMGYGAERIMRLIPDLELYDLKKLFCGNK